MSYKSVVCRLIGVINWFSIKKHDIIMTQFNGLGDFVLWLDCVKQIKEKYAGRKLTLVCGSNLYEFAKGSGLFDKIITLDLSQKRTWFHLWGIKSNVVITPTATTTAIHTMQCICAKEKYIRTWPTEVEKIKRQVGSHTIPIIVPNDQSFDALKNQYFINGIIGKNQTKIHLADLSCFIDEVDIDGDFFVVNLGVSAPIRRWPIERFAFVSGHLASKTGWTCVLIGTEKDNYLSEIFMQHYQGAVINKTGKTTIKEMISLIAKADLVLCNDTSTVHIAAAVQTKCVCVSPRGTYGTFTDYRAGQIDTNDEDRLPLTIVSQNCSAGYSRCYFVECGSNNQPLSCLMDIMPEDVCGKIDDYLGV